MLSAINTSDRGEFTASVRHPTHILRIAWNKSVDSTIDFAVVGTSTVGGKDIVQGNLTVFTKPDAFKYIEETVNALKIETERILEEPLGGIAYAQADFTLDNNSLRYSPNINSTVGTALAPKKPVKIYLGLKIGGVDRSIPNVYGLTGMPVENKNNRTVGIHCFDYIKFLDETYLESTMYTDQRSDQIIRDLLVNEAGFSTDQIVLDTGLNIIPFAWFEKGTSIGNAIRKVCEAEEAVFYQDEQGLLLFENRRRSRLTPFNAPVWTINPEDILLWEEDPNPILINRATVKSNPREVQATQEIWRDGITEEIGPGATKEVWASFDDPVSAITTPVASTDYIANSASDGSGSVLTSDISIVVTSFAKDAKLQITNNGTMLAYMLITRLRGTPAIVTSKIEEIYEDDSSVSKYDRHELIVENDFINNSSFADYLAQALVDKYKEPRKRLLLTVPAIPTLQLRDMVRVKDMDAAGLVDNFNDNSTDATLWTDVGDPPVTTSEANGQVTVTPGTNDDGYGGRQSVGTYDLTGNAFSIRVIHPANTTNNTETQMILAADDNNQILFVVTNGSIVCRRKTAGVNSDTFPGWSGDYRYWRLREASGTVYWEVSTNNQDWTTLRSTTVSFSLKTLQMRLQAGTYDSQPAPGSFIFDDVCFANGAAEVYKNYRVMRIQNSMFPSQYTQRLTLRETFTGETDAWASVGVTLVGTEDELVGV